MHTKAVSLEDINAEWIGRHLRREESSSLAQRMSRVRCRRDHFLLQRHVGCFALVVVAWRVSVHVKGQGTETMADTRGLAASFPA